MSNNMETKITVDFSPIVICIVLLFLFHRVFCLEDEFKKLKSEIVAKTAVTVSTAPSTHGK